MKTPEPSFDEGRETEVLIIALDCGRHAKKNPEHFEQLREVAAHMARHRLIYSGSVADKVGVFKLGSRTTYNRLADTNPGGYQHIERAYPANQRSPQPVQCLRNAQVEGMPFHLIDALETLGDYFAQFESAAAKRSRVAFFTHKDAAGEKVDDEMRADLVATCNLYRQAGLQVNFVCVDWPEDIEEDDDDEGGDAGVPTPSEHYFKVAQEKGLPMVWAIARACGGFVASIQEAAEGVNLPEARAVRPVARFRGTLDIGNDVRIPIKCFYVISEKTKESAKKVSWAQSCQESQRVSVTVDVAKVKSVTDTEPLEEEQIVCAYPYGSQLVPTEEEEQWAVNLPAGMSTIGFVPVDKVPPEWFMSAVTAVVPMKDVHGARVAMDALVQALHNDGKGILARWVNKLKGGAPVLAFLWPIVETEGDTDVVKNRFLYSVELPMKEDLKVYAFPSYRKERNDPNEAHANAMDAFIDCRMLDGTMKNEPKMEDVEADQEEEEEEEFDPMKECNPALHRFYVSVVQRALDGIEGDGLPPLAEWQKHLLDSSKCIPEERKERVDDSLKQLKISLPVSKVAPKERTKRMVSEALRATEASISDFLPPEDEDGEELMPYEGENYLAGGMEW